MVSGQRRSVQYSQNFLKYQGLAKQLVRRSSITADDTVVEIGPGRGALSRYLARQSRQLIVVEKDARLATSLSQSLRDAGNVTVYLADFLDVPLPLTPYKVFANIPFNVTADIIRHLTQAANPPEVAYLAVQREAAERFMGQPRVTLVSTLLHPWFELAIEHRFRAVDFVPMPRVALVPPRYSKRGPPLAPFGEAPRYRDFVTHGLTAWAPSIREAYWGALDWAAITRTPLDPSLRFEAKPSELSHSGWLALSDPFTRFGRDEGGRSIQGAERLLEQQSRLSKQRRGRAIRPPRQRPRNDS